MFVVRFSLVLLLYRNLNFGFSTTLFQWQKNIPFNLKSKLKACFSWGQQRLTLKTK